MATWNSRGLRGSTLEELINYSNEIYREKELGLVQKIPTPITPVKIDKENGNISLAYFEKDSTVDYIGVIQGVPVCFDAKECATDTFSLRNIHEHQIKFMEDFEKQQGISFLIIMFSARNEFYYMRFSELKIYLDRVNDGHAKNFKYDELDKKYFIPSEAGVVVHYLRALMNDLEERRN
ncbi:MAG: Holliday junction resolvase RecU [Lachnospiraceae bacterium]|nr:Holliday junction resolvase RecU [Lachnospiraceae bacterium]